MSNEKGYKPEIITSVNQVNQRQKQFFLNKVFKRFGNDLSGLTFAVWGLSFKPETDDMRKAPSIFIIKELIKRGAKIKAYDPKAMNISKTKYLKGFEVFYANDKYEAINDVDGLILLTEWKEFRSPNFDVLKRKMKQAILFDGRNQYCTFALEKNKFEYFQIGKK
jgi:UDPglucose 6-dehydrogenase